MDASKIKKARAMHIERYHSGGPCDCAARMDSIFSKLADDEERYIRAIIESGEHWLTQTMQAEDILREKNEEIDAYNGREGPLIMLLAQCHAFLRVVLDTGMGKDTGMIQGGRGANPEVLMARLSTHAMSHLQQIDNVTAYLDKEIPIKIAFNNVAEQSGIDPPYDDVSQCECEKCEFARAAKEHGVDAADLDRNDLH